MKLKTIIIDDEKYAREALKDLLLNFDLFEVVKEFQSATQALKELYKIQPDIIFTDIEMPGLKGTEFADIIKNFDTKIIIISAYTEYSIKAFELNIFDYLLKPVSIERFSKTVEKLQKELKFKSIEKLPVKNDEGIEFIDLNDIKYFESFDKTLIVYHNKGKSEVYKYKISEIESITKNKILRVHKSYAVNIEKIIKFGHLIGKSWFVTLNTGEKVHVSKTYVENLKKRLNL
ncbi:DNA-binding response regulator [Tepiditoga spiralis]|uniref:DNA-binding response regulator n=1 Tax=Tepiditoga spiralis TaxID=2108365 RepID=A0A7G1G6M4_9BACT|nr:LytTR family DNA-binding domain-containing protein [Tepiditoga spiralis]BBE30493.1 DNA-binding response regulator [Tepiditoga spiralis]